MIMGHGSEGIELCSHCLFCGSGISHESIDDVTDDYFGADDGVFVFRRCADCGSLWLHNRPVGARLLKAYSTYYTHAGDRTTTGIVSGLRQWVRASYYRSRLAGSASLLDRFVARAVAVSGWDTAGLDKGSRHICAPFATILDYGCGNGDYLLSLKSLGYELHGAEYDPQLIDMLADAGITIHDVTNLHDNTWDCYFDHITLSHVLEHIPDPQELLLRLFLWLKPGGSVYIEVPNAGASLLAIFGRYWRGLEAPRHFALPSTAALIAALERAGFIIEQQHLDPAARHWMCEASLKPLPQSDRSGIVAQIGKLAPETTANTELLTFVARKPL